jgi:uncharacterized protein YjiS (DUF1127 family)
MGNPMMIEGISTSGPQAALGKRNALRSNEGTSFRQSWLNRFQYIATIWLARHRTRQELLDFLNQDHRVAQDLGATEDELKAWIQKPFWRP